MELGEKLRRARLEAGLSQRQLCGEEITRNMLSLIEHGTARPSMKTLQYLAARLGKSVSYFLEETAVLSPNQEAMAQARRCFDSGDASAALQALAAYRAPDETFDREYGLLWVLCHLSLAEAAAGEGRNLYALELLGKADIPAAYCGESLLRRRLLLLGRVQGTPVCAGLPSLDEELSLRAVEALAAGDPERAAHLLESMDHRDSPHWHLLRGDSLLATESYAQAASHFLLAEEAFPRQTAPKLEHCYRELQDFRQAYEYACRQKS